MAIAAIGYNAYAGQFLHARHEDVPDRAPHGTGQMPAAGEAESGSDIVELSPAARVALELGGTNLSHGVIDQVLKNGRKDGAQDRRLGPLMAKIRTEVLTDLNITPNELSRMNGENQARVEQIIGDAIREWLEVAARQRMDKAPAPIVLKQQGGESSFMDISA